MAPVRPFWQIFVIHDSSGKTANFTCAQILYYTIYMICRYLRGKALWNSQSICPPIMRATLFNSPLPCGNAHTPFACVYWEYDLITSISITKSQGQEHFRNI